MYAAFRAEECNILWLSWEINNKVRSLNTSCFLLVFIDPDIQSELSHASTLSSSLGGVYLGGNSAFFTTLEDRGFILMKDFPWELINQIHNKIENKYKNLVHLLKQQTEMILSLKQLVLENLHIHSPIQEKQPPSLHSTILLFEILLENKIQCSLAHKIFFYKNIIRHFGEKNEDAFWQ